jgi:hypothetical protein
MGRYKPERHEQPRGADWTDTRARAAIERIVADTHRRFSAERLWPIQPFDASGEPPAALKPLYFGAAGVVWAPIPASSAMPECCGPTNCTAALKRGAVRCTDSSPTPMRSCVVRTRCRQHGAGRLATLGVS